MIITCEACGTSFKVKSSLIQETGSTVRCSKCQQVFIAYPKSLDKDKPADFTIDEALEAKIDNVLGQEVDEEFTDLESEISLETADIPMATAEELFESAPSGRKDRQTSGEEPEILLSDLEQQDDDIISMDSLLLKSTAEESVDAWLEEPESESDIISFGELGAKATAEDISEIVSLDDIGQEQPEIAFDDLESSQEAEEDVLDLGKLESAGQAEEEPAEKTSEEEEVDFLDFEDEAVPGKKTAEIAADEIEMALDENLADTAEFVEIEPTAEVLEIETKGGVERDLDAFDLEKGSEEEDTSKGTAKKAGEKAEVKTPAQDASKKQAEEEDFELDFELEPEETAEVSKVSAEDKEFDLDLDLAADVSEEVSEKADDLGMELDGFEELELTEEPAEKVSEDLDLDLDFASGENLESEDIGLDLDLDKELADIDSDKFSLDLDLDEQADKKSKAKAQADEDLDLDFGFDAEAKEEAGAGESFELDLNIEPEPVKGEAPSDEFDLDLDFDEGQRDESAAASVAEDKGARKKAEELDLTQIEDVLDFDAMPESEEAGRGDNLKDLSMEGEGAAPFTASDDEMSIDLETMLEEETPGAVKEVSLETVEEREQQIEKTYRKTVVEKKEEPEEVVEETHEEEEDAYLDRTRMMGKPYAQPVMESRNLKKILIPLILLIALGAILYAGIKMFGAKEEAPVTPVKPAVTDQGNLRMEMIAEPAYQFVENKVAGEILVVTGNVTNRYDHPRSQVMVKAVLYDSAGKVIVTSSAYAGNMFTQAELTGLDLNTLAERMNNRRGDNNANIGVAPGNSIPFTVVFSNLPENISELTVEAVQSEK